MHRHVIFAVALVTAAILASPALEAIAAGPGVFRSRNRSNAQAAPRVYRSYSVSPGSESVPEGVSSSENAAAVDAPARAAVRQSKPARSKPSYMRGDSKAMGRFGQ